MLFLTPKVLRELQAVVTKYTGVVALVAFGPDAVAPETIELATKLGMIDPKNPPPGIATLLHAFGAYTAAVGRQRTKSLALADFRAMFAAGQVPQGPEERRSAEAAARRGASAMANASLRLSASVTEAAETQDEAGYADLRSAVRDTIAARFGDEEAEQRMRDAAPDDDFFDGVFRATRKRIESDIGHLTEEWDRDLGRIAQTELTAALHAGQVARWHDQAQDAAEAGRPPGEVYVYKVPRPGACKHCERLYSDGGFPRVYVLSDVQGNSNVGRRVADWTFVIGPTHPWCFPAGTPVQTPAGYQAIEQLSVGDLVLTHRGRWRRVTRQASRAHRGALVAVAGQLVTPEHPYLTSRGWVAAGGLHHSDELIRAVDVPLVDAEHTPTLIDEVGFLASVLGGLPGRAMPATAIDLHCQHCGRQREIDQVSTDLVPRAGSESGSEEGLVSRLFQLGAKPPGLGRNPFLDHVIRLGLAPASIIGGADLGAACFGIERLPLPARGLRAGPHRDTGANQVSRDRLSGSSDGSADLQDALSALVSADEIGHVERFPARHAGLQRREYNHTTVHNIAVQGDESFVIGDGQVVHNCACVLMRVPPFVKMPRGWRPGEAAPSVIGPKGRLV